MNSILRRCSQLFLGLLLVLHSSQASADSKIFAYRLFNRLNGTPPTADKLTEIQSLIDQGRYDDAGMAAINDPSGNFYNMTLRNVFTRWSNVDGSPRRELNDYVATAIGIVRDDLPFGQLLHEDIVYVGDGATRYSVANNDVYTALQTQGANLATTLKRSTQSGLTGLPPEAIAGIFSLRGFGEAYYSAGTNRRAVAFVMKTFLCRSMESLNDTSRPDIRVRRDVTRSPGGFSAKFRNECAGCHAGMDGFAGAFAYYDYDMANKSLVYTPGVVGPKFNRNSTEFPDGFVTTGADWINMWIDGRNQSLGWGKPTSGVGARAFGEMLASTQAFSSCMAQTAVETMCARPSSATSGSATADKDAIDSIAREFQSNGNFKNAFIKAAVYCSK